jgi:sarcosine oxidase
VLEETPVRAIRLSGESVEVVTDGRTYLTSRVVVASDAWTTEVLGKAGTRIPLTVTQEQVTYYATPNLRQFSPERFPVVMWHGADNFYGFPVYGEVATKLGQHMGGHEVTAKTRTFEPDPGRLERYRGFLGRHIPGFLGPEIYTKTCLYTIPPDQNFIIDTLPEHPPVSVAIGAGHAYKFAGLIGRILSELVLNGESLFPIGAFRLDRPAMFDAAFGRTLHV